MKVPTPRQLPSGAWNVRIQLGGKTHSITRPTEKECLAEALAVKAGQKEARTPSRRTVSAAIDAYIEARQDVLSPTTVRGYRAIKRTRFRTAMSRRIEDVTPDQWQRIVNAEARLCSAKTLKNAWNFLSAVIDEATGRRITVRLPQVVRSKRPFLTPEEIPTFLAAIRGEHCEAAMLLALSGLRRSEVMAVRWESIDLQRGCIYVHGSAVIDEDGTLVRREENKNTASRRTVPFLIPQLREYVERTPHTTEYVVTCHPNSIYNAINRVCRSASLPEIGVHGLRRSFASLAYHLGLSEEVTMRAGGWSDIYTMRSVYTDVSEKDYLSQAQLLSDFFDPKPKKKRKTGTKTGTKSKTA